LPAGTPEAEGQELSTGQLTPLCWYVCSLCWSPACSV